MRRDWSRLTTKLSGPGHGPASYESRVSAARGRGPLQREVRRPSTARSDRVRRRATRRKVPTPGARPVPPAAPRRPCDTRRATKAP